MITEITVRIIRNEEDYQAALQRIDQLLDTQPGSSEDDELEVLSTLVAAYEEKLLEAQGLTTSADPVTVIRYVMEQQGLRQVDLAPLMGGKNRVSEVLSGKKPLTLKMIKNLHNALHIPVEALLGK